MGHWVDGNVVPCRVAVHTGWKRAGLVLGGRLALALLLEWFQGFLVPVDVAITKHCWWMGNAGWLCLVLSP